MNFGDYLLRITVIWFLVAMAVQAMDPIDPWARQEGSSDLRPQDLVPVWDAGVYRSAPVHHQLGDEPSTSSPHIAVSNPGAGGSTPSAGSVEFDDDSVWWTDHLGQRWGPFKINQQYFSLHSYPFRIKSFVHHYENPDTSPADFRNYFTERGGTLMRRGIFFPEPELLERVQAEVQRKLGEKQIQRQAVTPNAPDLLEAQFIWPPVERVADTDKLQFSDRTLAERLFKAVTIKMNNLEGKFIYHLPVTVNGQTRQIAVNPGVFSSWIAPDVRRLGSRLFLFYEAREVNEVRRMSFLGAMFLPNQAQAIFSQARLPG